MIRPAKPDRKALPPVRRPATAKGQLTRLAAEGEPLPVGARGERTDRSQPVQRDHAARDWRGRVDLPQAQRAVAPGADETTAFRREREAGNPAVVPDKIVHGGARVGRRQIVQADQPIGLADGEPAPVGRVGRGHHIRRVAVQRQACGGA